MQGIEKRMRNLYYRTIIVQIKIKKFVTLCFSDLLRIYLWYLQESNQGHMDFQSIALPTELRYRLNAGANIRGFLIYPK